MQEHAGKGVSVKYETAIYSGYKEVVDFGEVIGDCLDSTGASLGPTVRGTIHYDKMGQAHIVPAPPRKKMLSILN